MKKVKKAFSFVVALVLIVFTAFSGCSNAPAQTSAAPESKAETASQAAPSETPKVDTSKEVEIVMYVLGSPSRDHDEVMKLFNEKAKADLNCTLKINYIGWGDFTTKYPLILSSGEPVDLIYVATWLNFSQQAQKGAFLPVDDLFKTYAPQSYASESPQALQQATVAGHLYAMAPNHTSYNTYGPMYRGDLLKKYGMTSIKTVDDYEKYLENVVKNDPTLDPTGMSADVTHIDTMFTASQGLHYLTGDIINCPFWVKIDDPDGKVINITQVNGIQDIFKRLKSWSDKGFWPKSVLSNKDADAFRNGKAGSKIHNMDTWIGDYRMLENVAPGADAQYTSFVPVYPLSYMQDGMAIPASAKNPERAMMLLEKIRNDQSYYNLLTYGIEGKHYKITNNLIETIDKDGFTQENGTWGFRDDKFFKDAVGAPPNLADYRQQLKNSAIENIYTGFSFNSDPVKNEYAAIQNVMTQYYVPLKLGYVDPVQGFEQLKQQLNAAGLDKVQAELQNQLTAFLQANKK